MFLMMNRVSNSVKVWWGEMGCGGSEFPLLALHIFCSLMFLPVLGFFFSFGG